MTSARHRPTGTSAGPTPVSLYVHVPFCLSRCAYCDFHSQAGTVDLTFGDMTAGDAFVDAVLRLAVEASDRRLLDDVPTLYVGGGTPTVLGERLVRLVEGIRAVARLRDDAEITVETNPETTGEDLVSGLVSAGVNRFSLGVQSFDDDVLATLGRRHDAATALRATEILRRSDMPFSIDLICGVPGQSMASWDGTLEAAVTCGARHVSVYPLSIEEGTPMAVAVEEDGLAAPDQDAAADMMLAAEVALAAAGLLRYEVANYAQPGFEARHNTVYWTGGAYLGLGPSAASMLPVGLLVDGMPESMGCDDGVDVAGEGCPSRARFVHHETLDGLLGGSLAECPSSGIEWLTSGEAAREDVMLGMRLTTGVTAAQADRAGVSGIMAGLATRGLVELAGDAAGQARWRTTQRGWLLGNTVFSALWTDE